MIELLTMNRSASAKLYVDDVFSAYARTGTGASATITTGNDISGKGGLVIAKSRSAATDWKFTDTLRGAQKALSSNSTAAESTDTNGITAFGSTGHTVGTDTNYNNSGATYIDYEFCKASKFFDVVTYTGNATAGRTIAHNLGSVPGCIIVKRLNGADNWTVYHRGIDSVSPQNYIIYLNTTEARSDQDLWADTAPTDSVFSVGDNIKVNGSSSNTYVAYLFAHDTTTDGIIQCGSVTTTGGNDVSLGWEPQFVIYKRSDGVENWGLFDSMRGMAVTSQNGLTPNSSGAEITGNDLIRPTANGMQFQGSGKTYIYLAIRRPNKPPASGTQVYNGVARTGTGAAATVTGVGFAPDLAWIKARSTGNFSTSWDRLRGATKLLRQTGTSAEETFTDALIGFDSMDGVRLGTDATALYINQNTVTFANWFFRRAPGVFDVVCYTGTGVARTVAHNLTVAPELMIVKNRSTLAFWPVYNSTLSGTNYLRLNTVDAQTAASTVWNNTNPTSSVFTVGTNFTVNQSADNYVSYLFATVAGVSKVGSYTGNGSNQTIDCGFSAGARFVLIKRTDSTGDWYIWDTVRGIVAGNDPHLSLNTTAAEVTTDDSIDTASSGFIVNQDAATNINVNTATYIFLAFA